ncbi:MAG: response regulator [Nitrospirae bacterium]|nr:response regulator [Nitrospirota bacterium]
MSDKYYGSILVVDDDAGVLNFTSLLLEKHGYSVIPCGSSMDAMDAMRDKKIDVVLTDIVMPEMSGIELLENVHTTDPDIPVILMTGYADMDKALEAIKKGAFDFITKPYKADYLVYSIEKAVNYHRLIKMEKDYKNTLEELNRELETLIAERAMNVMALTVADRVRNPATTIGWIGRRMLEKEDVPERLKEGLAIILGEAAKLETIVRDFHAFLKDKESMFRYEDINSVLKDIIPLIDREATVKDVKIAAEISEQPLKINMEKNLLKTAFLHLMRNAVEATPSGCAITIRTSQDPGSAIFEISDTGHGIPKEDIERIFDPFFSTKKHRFGMGLSLVKQIVSAHMGEIDVQSETDKGTTFRLIFPLRWTEKTSEHGALAG